METLQTLNRTKNFLSQLQCPKAHELVQELDSIIENFINNCPKHNQACPCGDRCGVDCCKEGCECEKKGLSE